MGRILNEERSAVRTGEIVRAGQKIGTELADLGFGQPLPGLDSRLTGPHLKRLFLSVHNLGGTVRHVGEVIQ